MFFPLFSYFHIALVTVEVVVGGAFEAALGWKGGGT